VLFFFALSCLAAATFGSVVVYQRGERRRLEAASGGQATALLVTGRSAPAAPSRTVEPTLETLQTGDIVDDGEGDWVVSGSLRYREEKETWSLHALDGGARRRWLEVRRRHGQLEVAFVDVADGLPAGQLLQGLTFAGQSFTLDLRGDARIVVDGEVPGRSSGACVYARYGGAGGALLLVEDEGPTRRAFFGSRVPPSSVSLMSGELNRAS
jgi:hypothetical protein